MTKGLLEYTFLLYNSKTFVKTLTVPNSVVFVEKDWNANSPVQLFQSLLQVRCRTSLLSTQSVSPAQFSCPCWFTPIMSGLQASIAWSHGMFISHSTCSLLLLLLLIYCYNYQNPHHAFLTFAFFTLATMSGLQASIAWSHGMFISHSTCSLLLLLLLIYCYNYQNPHHAFLTFAFFTLATRSSIFL